MLLNVFFLLVSNALTTVRRSLISVTHIHTRAHAHTHIRPHTHRWLCACVYACEHTSIFICDIII